MHVAPPRRVAPATQRWCSDRYKRCATGDERWSAVTGRGRPEQRQAFLSGAVEHVLRHGVSGLSLRPLAAELGTSDRMLLYYFGSREHLLETVLDLVGDGLVAALSDAVPPGRSHPEVLLRELWSVARDPGVEPALRLYLEIFGQAAAQVAPFPAAARRVAPLAGLGARSSGRACRGAAGRGRRSARYRRRPPRPGSRHRKQGRRSSCSTARATRLRCTIVADRGSSAG